jgi:two-component system, OmpR family, response regulator
MLARTIAIVEDEPAIRDNYADLFRRQGYQVQAFPGRREAEMAFGDTLPDLVILDIGLNDEIDGGFELCRKLRARSPTLPIIFLTARDSDFDSVVGLRLGADDYLTKDVSLPQLSARIAALFRRVDALAEADQDSAGQKPLVTGALHLDMDRLQASWQGQGLPLTVTEIWILHALVRHPGHVRSRDQLMEAADTYVDGATITSHIKRLRKKFAQIDTGFDRIESVYGAGYRWNP